MDQRSAQQTVRQVLDDFGFRTVHESTAVTILENPDYPDVTVRIGTTRVIAEWSRHECYRSRLTDFDLDSLLAAIVGHPPADDFSEADRV